MTPSYLRRRVFLENCIVRGLLVAAVPVSDTKLFALWQQAESQARQPTPREVLGPFFKKGAPNRKDLRVPGETGFPLRISGKVLNTRGDIVPGATVDLWHADNKGIYDVQGYRYRSKLVVEAPGDYQVETVMPGHYPDRPAQHVHYMIQAPGHKPLITQLYFATDPYFEGDLAKNYAKGGIVSSRESIRPVLLHEAAGASSASVTFDLILEKA